MSQIEYAHLVLVEDDLALAEITSEYLRMQGYRVTVISNGLDAVNKIPTLNPDCVILDIMLPGLDGMEVCRRVRLQYQGPIIFLTARGDSVDEILGLEVGGDDYLAKPVEPRLLLAHIRAHIRRTESSAEPVQPSSRLVIDESKNEIQLDSKPMNLSQPEYQLLKLMKQKAGEIISRDDIMLAIRGIEHDGLSRTVDILVSDLRKKLPDPEWIKTIRGKGYLWQGS